MLAIEPNELLNWVMINLQKAELPPSELGDDRCFEIGYFGHGDIVVSAWNGTLDLEPSRSDGISTRFGFAHGNDALILASMAGYLKRLGRSNDEVRETLQESGKNILEEELGYYHSLRTGSLNMIAAGNPMSRFDDEERGFACLVSPTPSQPGLIEKTGGTGIYTRETDAQIKHLVFAGFTPHKDNEGNEVSEISRTVEFCEQDVPVMARLVCNLALGEYRSDLIALLTNLYVPEEG